MPSMAHEVLVDLFKNRPALAAEMLAEVLDVSLPAYTEARLASTDLTEIQPAEYRADVVVILLEGDVPVRVVIVEVQLAVDHRKRLSWPVYLATPIREPRSPRSVEGHPGAGRRQDQAVCRSLVQFLERGGSRTLEGIMKGYEYQSDFAKKYVAQGHVEGRVEGRVEEAVRNLLTVFRARGLAVSDASRERILAQKDPERLERWLENAVVAASVAAVLDEPN